MEEAGEVIQAASKIGRFGENDNWPGYGNNIEVLEHEYNDILAVIEELKERGIVLSVKPEKITAKREKLKDMLNYSRSLGLVGGK